MPSFDHYMMESQRGLSNTLSPMTVVGEAPAIGLVEVKIQPWVDAGLPAVAGTCTIESDSADDTFGGSGLQVALVRGLDGGYTNGGLSDTIPFYEEPVLMAGLTPVELSIDLLRAQLIVGIVGNAVGTVTVKIGGVVQLVKRSFDGTSKSLQLTCPAGWTCYDVEFMFKWSDKNNAIRVDCRDTLGDGTEVGNFATDIIAGDSFVRLGVGAIRATHDVACYGFKVGGGGTEAVDASIAAWGERDAT